MTPDAFALPPRRHCPALLLTAFSAASNNAVNGRAWIDGNAIQFINQIEARQSSSFYDRSCR